MSLAEEEEERLGNQAVCQHRGLILSGPLGKWILCRDCLGGGEWGAMGVSVAGFPQWLP